MRTSAVVKQHLRSAGHGKHEPTASMFLEASVIAVTGMSADTQGFF